MTDTEQRYRAVSRLLHWAMAFLLLWQFLTAASHLLLGDTPVEEFMFGTHKATGFLLLVLVLIRVGWAWANRSDWPPSLKALATIGHRALYVLLIVVPLLALVREYGSGDSFSPFGLPLVPGFDGDEINWMTAPGNILHSWLGWLLLVLIVGHVSMVFVYRRRPEDPDVLKRMLGR